jgi:hypothetical protein
MAKPASKKPASKPASKKPASKPAVPKKVDRRDTDVMKILAQEGVSFAKAVKKSPFTKK